MSLPSDTSQDHPEELLAGYADGESTAAERAVVEAHLATCYKCREELDLAGVARAALASLPDLESPGLAALGLAGLRQADSKEAGDGQMEGRDAAVVPPRVRGRWRDRRPAVVPALAAAAIVVIAGLLTVPILLRGGGGGRRASAPSSEAVQTPAPSPLPAVVDSGASYTPATLDTLVNQLVPAAKQFEGKGPPSATPAAGTPNTGSGRSTLSGAATDAADQAQSRAAFDCLVMGGGLSPSAVPLYLESARFKGVPVYLGAFVTPGARLDFSLVAVSQAACQPLYTLSRPA